MGEYSRVVVPLRVATPCYTTGQRTLLGRGVSTPKWCRQAAFECPESCLVGRLLRRTSENPNSTQLGEYGQERRRAEVARPRPSITWLCSDQLVLTKASMSTRVDVEDAFFCPSTLTSSLWVVVELTALLKTTVRACTVEEYRSKGCIPVRLGLASC